MYLIIFIHYVYPEKVLTINNLSDKRSFPGRQRYKMLDKY